MLVAVVSVKGSPGVTTFSVALAARWPARDRVVLVEADPSGGDVATRFCLPPSPGLLSLAAAARGTTDPGLLWQHTEALPGGLAVVTAPPDADLTRAALQALGSPSNTSLLRAAANMPGTAVLVDCGRVDPDSAAMDIVRQADVLVMLTRAHAEDLAHLARRLLAVGRWAPHAMLLLVGEGYSVTEVSRELGVVPLGRIPHDRRGAAVLCGRSSSRWGRSGPSRSALGRFAHRVAGVLAPTFPSAPSSRMSFVEQSAVRANGPRPAPNLPAVSPIRQDQGSWGGVTS